MRPCGVSLPQAGVGKQKPGSDGSPPGWGPPTSLFPGLPTGWFPAKGSGDFGFCGQARGGLAAVMVSKWPVAGKGFLRTPYLACSTRGKKCLRTLEILCEAMVRHSAIPGEATLKSWLKRISGPGTPHKRQPTEAGRSPWTGRSSNFENHFGRKKEQAPTLGEECRVPSAGAQGSFTGRASEHTGGGEGGWRASVRGARPVARTSWPGPGRRARCSGCTEDTPPPQQPLCGGGGSRGPGGRRGRQRIEQALGAPPSLCQAAAKTACGLCGGLKRPHSYDHPSPLTCLPLRRPGGVDTPHLEVWNDRTPSIEPCKERFFGREKPCPVASQWQTCHDHHQDGG